MIVFKLFNSKKEAKLIFVRLEGKLTCSTFSHSIKAFSPISVMYSGSFTSFRSDSFFHLIKMLFSILAGKKSSLRLTPLNATLTSSSSSFSIWLLSGKVYSNTIVLSSCFCFCPILPKSFPFSS